MTEIPAGWYPDPSVHEASGRLRYWDGGAWTDHTTQTPSGPPTPVTTDPTTPDGQRLAGWWLRVAAYVIDVVIVGVANSIASLPAQIAIQRDLRPVLDRFERQIDQDPDAFPDFGSFFHDYLDVYQAHWVGITAPGVVLALTYWMVFLRWKGATPGKMMLGLRIRPYDAAGPLPWPTIVARIAVQLGITWVAWVVAIATGSLLAFGLMTAVTFVMLLDPLWAAWDSRHQALHDKAAGTVVVRTKD